jgi:hypothetical protein
LLLRKKLTTPHSLPLFQPTLSQSKVSYSLLRTKQNWPLKRLLQPRLLLTPQLLMTKLLRLLRLLTKLHSKLQTTLVKLLKLLLPLLSLPLLLLQTLTTTRLPLHR